MIPKLVASDRQHGLCRVHGLLFGHDMPVAHWTWNEFRLTPMAICSAIGIVRDNCIVGSILFQDYNGFNVEMSYYGPATPSVGILRAVARFALERFNVDRLTIRTNRKNDRVMKTLSRYGFKFEGVQRRFYGQFGDAASFVVFREDLERISKIKERNTAS